MEPSGSLTPTIHASGAGAASAMEPCGNLSLRAGYLGILLPRGVYGMAARRRVRSSTSLRKRFRKAYERSDIKKMIDCEKLVRKYRKHLFRKGPRR